MTCTLFSWINYYYCSQHSLLESERFVNISAIELISHNRRKSEIINIFSFDFSARRSAMSVSAVIFLMLCYIRRSPVIGGFCGVQPKIEMNPKEPNVEWL